MVHWCRTVCGPVGNCGGCHLKNQLSFNSSKWLKSKGATLGGFIIHTEEYVNCIQVIGNQELSETGMYLSSKVTLLLIENRSNTFIN